MRAIPAAIAVALTTATLAGCSAQQATCAVGYAPTFFLTVRSPSPVELSVQFCDDRKCSPAPKPGKIPVDLVDPAALHSIFISHLSRNEWSIRPSDPDAPTSGTVRLYRDGTLASSHGIHLTWPRYDPCATSNPLPPHVTITTS